jgi:phosphoglycerate dehydrogenase-like enzyme
MNKKLKMFVRFLLLNPEQISILNELGVTVTKTLDADVNAVFSDQFFVEANLDKFPKLKYLQLATSGADLVNLKHPNLIDAVVSGSRGVFNQPMAEYVLSHLLSVYQNHRFFNQTKIDQQWRPSRHGEELAGKKVAIIGLGQIGLHLAKVLATFGCEVDGFNRTKKESIYVKNVFPLNDLKKQLGQYEVVITAIALNESTRHLINAEVFGALNPKAIFVNISRAEVVDETALIEALKNNKLRYAILDTFSQEPLPKDHPLWTIEQVTLTPHISFTSPKNLPRMFDALVANLKLYQDDGFLINQLK